MEAVAGFKPHFPPLPTFAASEVGAASSSSSGPRGLAALPMAMAPKKPKMEEEEQEPRLFELKALQEPLMASLSAAAAVAQAAVAPSSPILGAPPQVEDDFEELKEDAQEQREGSDEGADEEGADEEGADDEGADEEGDEDEEEDEEPKSLPSLDKFRDALVKAKMQNGVPDAERKPVFPSFNFAGEMTQLDVLKLTSTLLEETGVIRFLVELDPMDTSEELGFVETAMRMFVQAMTAAGNKYGVPVFKHVGAGRPPTHNSRLFLWQKSHLCGHKSAAEVRASRKKAKVRAEGRKKFMQHKKRLSQLVKASSKKVSKAASSSSAAAAAAAAAGGGGGGGRGWSGGGGGGEDEASQFTTSEGGADMGALGAAAAAALAVEEELQDLQLALPSPKRARSGISAISAISAAGMDIGGGGGGGVATTQINASLDFAISLHEKLTGERFSFEKRTMLKAMFAC